MTKAQRILELYAKGLPTREIAEAVGSDPAYVRVVARQRKGTRRSKIDLRYNRSPLARETRKALYRQKMEDPAYREWRNSYYRDYYHRRKAAP